MRNRIIQPCSIAICLILILIANPLPVEALSVGHSGSFFPLVSPGQSFSQILNVSIGANDPPANVLIEVLGYKENKDGIDSIEPDQDTGLYSARNFIQPSQIILYCQPGEVQQTQININIPPDANSGGRYALIRFSTVPIPGTGVGVASSIILPMKFTITGGPLTHTGKIEAITTSNTTSGNPIDIYTSFTNTGNHHFDIKGQTKISDNTGKLIDTVFINTSSPIPDSTKQIKTSYIPEKILTPGIYTINTRLTLDDGNLLDEDSSFFEVQEPYVPPPAPAKVTVVPASSAILQTQDGRISISFPSGAVLSQAELSLRSYPLEQLPPPPDKYYLGNTAFRVDGLNGLLVKPSTLKVQYSSADLKNAAPGTVLQLVLARWDEASANWVIAETKVDSKAMILTAETNQFGLWAVMVSPASSEINESRFIVIIILIVISIILGMLIVKQRRNLKKKE